jgi:hypothetical protein
MTLPNFLVIGAAKAGTTAMWHYLGQHPQIYMSPHKEPRYFALCGRPVDFRGPGDMTRFHFVTDFADYEALFDGVKGETAIGEASPWYLYVPSAAPAIKERLPGVKLVAILREPVERAFSNYLHAVREGLEPLRSFREAMEAEEGRIQAGWSPRFHYRQKGFYYQQLSHYLEFFDRRQFWICLYDDFLENPAEVFADLFNFLDIDSEFEVDVRQKLNVSWVPRSRALAQILREGNTLTRGMRRVVPKGIREKIKERIGAFNERPKPILSAEDRARYRSEYRDDVLQLESLLERNLERWTNEDVKYEANSE